MSMSESPTPGPWSTVAALPDYLLLAQTRQLARHEQALQILVLDHLREIEARRLHLTRGYGSLFDYVVHELGYTAAAAWRRIKAMRLCGATNGARELLQDGKLNLSNAAQLQNLFERSDRGHGRPPGSQGTGGGPSGTPRSDGAPGEAAPMRAGERDLTPGAGPVLDAAAREELVRRAAGKSTREVQRMVAEVDPESAQPNDRMRVLGGGRWELKATIDAECRHGLEKLQMLLSHQDPHLSLGGLVARLVRDGLDRYDPARPPRTRRTGNRGSVNGARSASEPAWREHEAVQRNVARAKGGAVERRSEVEPDDVSVAAVRGGAPRPSAAKRSSEPEPASAAPAAMPTSGRPTASSAKRQSEAEHHRAARLVARDGGGRAVSAAKRGTEAERGGMAPAAAPNSGGHTTSAAKSAAVRDIVRHAASAPKRHAYGAGYGATGPAERSPTLQRHLAALSCFGALPGSRSRYIPVAVRREVWRRDHGCCSYVDPHGGRRCGSRYRLEIDHIVPFALGGGAEPGNLRLHCRAHHRYRHAHGHAHPASVPTEARRAPGSAVDPVEPFSNIA